MTKKDKVIPQCYKCKRPLPPILLKTGHVHTITVKDDEGNEKTHMICPLCNDEK